MEDFEDYDETQGSWSSHLIAGACAGVSEHTVMIPIDSIKTRMQVNYPGYESRSVLGVIMYEARRGRALKLFNGSQSVVIGAGPAHALYYSTYEYCKRLLCNPESTTTQTQRSVGFAAAGAVATVLNDGIMTPFDTMKQRLQVVDIAKPYTGIVDCAKTIVRTEGWGALWVAYPTTLVMNIPYTAVQFACYEKLSSVLEGYEGTLGASYHAIAGGGASAIAAAVTNPLDVAKTRLQTQCCMVPGLRYTGMVHALSCIFQHEGVSGFMKGVTPRMMFFAPAGGIAWTTYELVKKVASKLIDGEVAPSSSCASTSTPAAQAAITPAAPAAPSISKTA